MRRFNKLKYFNLFSFNSFSFNSFNSFSFNLFNHSMTIGSKNAGPKKKGGKRAKKGKKFVPENTKSKHLLLKDDKDQEYVKVVSLLGECRVKTEDRNGTVRICNIRGKMRKRVWIAANDIVLIGLRDFQDDKGDIIHKYSMAEAKELVKRNEIPANMLIIGADDLNNEDDDGIEWNIVQKPTTSKKTINEDNNSNDNSNDDENNGENNSENNVPPQREIKDISDESDDSNEINPDNIDQIIKDL